MKGKLITIDGIDSSGKATQADLLIKRLNKFGYQAEVADFPQYNTKSAGLVEEYLDGKYGGVQEVGPYASSIFYAADRYDASFKIKEWLVSGKIVVSNRYVGANMAHQGCKIKDDEERKKYLGWLYDLEYNIFKIPRPDLNIILHINAVTAQELSQQRAKKEWHKKTNDIHEDSLTHLEEAERTYLEIADVFSDFVLIECSENRRIMPREKINDLVWREAMKIIK